MKERMLKWLKYVPVFVLMLFFSFSLDVKAATISFNNPPSSVDVPAIYCSAGYENTYTVSFQSTLAFNGVNIGGSYRFILYITPSLSYPDGNYSITLENVRMSYNGKLYYASYITSGTGGLYCFDFSDSFYTNAHYSILMDVKTWATHTGIISGITCNLGMGEQSISRLPDAWQNSVIDNTAHEDAQKALEESKKQTSALTEFSRKDEMSSNASSNGSIMGNYSDSEDAVVSGAHDGLSKFDFLAPLKFASGLSQSILLCSTWLSDLIAAMGDFSFIFTLGSALTIIICIFVGLSRFKRGG